MRTIAIANQKGGVGKTATTVNTAAALAERGRRVLVADLDAQASATSWFGVSNVGKGVYSVFVDNVDINGIIINTDVEGIDVIPASEWLAAADHELASKIGKETLLKRQLSKLDQSRWDYLLIDCPPSLGTLTINALVAVTEVFVPVETRLMAADGLRRLMDTIQAVKDADLNPQLEITGILACRANMRTRHAQEVVMQLRSHFGDIVFNVVIRDNVRISESWGFSQPITIYDSQSAGAQDYRALADQVIAMEEGS